MPSLRLPLLCLLLTLSSAVVACGSDDSEKEASGPGATATAAAPAPEPTEAPADLKDTETRPVIAKPTGDPPTKLVKKDIVKGKGKRAKAGDTVSVQYAGVSFSTGDEFDASWNRGEPFEFSLGAGQVIPGWDEGVAGMRVGGRRQLTIPPDQAYGAAGSPPAIGADETLIFVIDLLEVS